MKNLQCAHFRSARGLYTASAHGCRCAHVMLADSSPAGGEEDTSTRTSVVEKSVTSWRERQARKQQGQLSLKEKVKKNKGSYLSPDSGQNNHNSAVHMRIFLFCVLVEVPAAILMHGRATGVERGAKLISAKDIHAFENEDALQLGHPILVKDGNRQLIGWGMFNPNSSHQVRMMQTVAEIPLAQQCVLEMKLLLQTRIQDAVKLRKLLRLPSDETNVYRLINSDGDRLPGMLVDVYGELVTVTSMAAWVEEFQSDIIDVIREETGIRAILWHPSPGALLHEGVPNPGSKLFSADDIATVPSTILVRDEGIKIHLCLKEEKVLFRIDQRESRVLIRRLSKGLRVLDLCCCAGGFSINAAIGGAKEVTGIDFPGPGIEVAKKNAVENGVEDICKFIAGNIASFMTVAGENGDTWDIVILDPPNLAPDGSTPQIAETRYRKLNKAAARLVKPGGLLLTSTCSSEMMVAGRFAALVQGSVITSGRHPAFLQESGAALDHVLDQSNPMSKSLANLLLAIQ